MYFLPVLALCGLAAATPAVFVPTYTPKMTQQDWATLRDELIPLMVKTKGPLLVRLAWHDAGTYDKNDGSGGPHAMMRFAPVSEHAANAGLIEGRALLEPLAQKYKKKLSHADLWSFAGALAVTQAGGPAIEWYAGREDVPNRTVPPPTPADRLPATDKGDDHVRSIFGRMGFDDRGIVALLGAHTLGFVRNGVSGAASTTLPWTSSPFEFNNAFYKLLIDRKWTANNFTTPFGDKTWEWTTEGVKSNYIMLPADYRLRRDPTWKPMAIEYSKNEEKFFKDFAKYWSQLLHLGVEQLKNGEKISVCPNGQTAEPGSACAVNLDDDDKNEQAPKPGYADQVLPPGLPWTGPIADIPDFLLPDAPGSAPAPVAPTLPKAPAPVTPGQGNQQQVPQPFTGPIAELPDSLLPGAPEPVPIPSLNPPKQNNQQQPGLTVPHTGPISQIPDALLPGAAAPGKAPLAPPTKNQQQQQPGAPVPHTGPISEIPDAFLPGTPSVAPLNPPSNNQQAGLPVPHTGPISQIPDALLPGAASGAGNSNSKNAGGYNAGGYGTAPSNSLQDQALPIARR